MGSIRDTFAGSSSLKPVDLEIEEGESKVLVVQEVFSVKFDDGEKLQLLFQKYKKPLTLNKTNVNFMCDEFGDTDTDDWIGKRVKVMAVMVKNPQGGQVLSLGLRKADPKPKQKPAEDDPYEEAA